MNTTGSVAATSPTAATAGATATGASATTAATVAGPATTAASSPTSGATKPAATAMTAASPTKAAATWAPRNTSASLTGSGSSFVDPVMQAWVEQYKSLAPNVSINYQSVGSGQGKKDFIGKVTDFGGTDATMTDDELKQAPDALHIPVVLGAVVMSYNLPDLADVLQFSGDTIAKIYLGEITTWNDPLLAADNPNVTLPDSAITVVHRSDGSGTTSIFTNYLSKVSSDWKDKVGSGTTVEWPAGIGAEKNTGVAAGVQQTPGAIGYIELIYALGNNLPTPAVKNHVGKFVTPSLDSTSAAAAGALKDIPDDLRVMVTDPQEGDDAYPISGFSWLLIHGEMQDENKAQALTDFVYWSLTEGTAIAKGLKYAPAPDAVLTLALQKIEQVKVNGTPAFTAP
jgi:phosphate transport system substrate-binding protein